MGKLRISLGGISDELALTILEMLHIEVQAATRVHHKYLTENIPLMPRFVSQFT